MGSNLPSVNVNKVQSNAGTVRPSPIVPAVIAPSSTGTQNQPAQFVRPVDLETTFGEGALPEFGTYIQSEDEIPVLAVRATTANPATYGLMVNSIAGTATPSFGSAALIADDYNVCGPGGVKAGIFGFVFNVVTGGALGTAGITYTVSFDGGNSTSAPIPLGTATTIAPTIPVTGNDSGIRVTLGTAAQTYLAGDYISFITSGPTMSTSDLTTSLEALRISKQIWDLLLVHGPTGSTFISLLDTWLAALEGTGRFQTAVVNTRFKNIPSGESEATYATAMGTLMAGTASIRISPCADGGAVTSTLSGITKSLPTSLALTARAEVISVGVDPAEVDLGNIGGYDLDDAFGNPLYHDEAIYPGLDILRLTTLRSFADPSYPGAYICNANLDSAGGSDYVYIQHARTMNLACATTFSVLTGLLSQGIRVNLATGYILEIQAAKWEATCQAAVDKVLAGQVSGTNVAISRTDDLTGNGPQTVTVTITNVALKYVKTFAVTAQFANTLPATT